MVNWCKNRNYFGIMDNLENEENNYYFCSGKDWKGG